MPNVLHGNTNSMTYERVVVEGTRTVASTYTTILQGQEQGAATRIQLALSLVHSAAHHVSQMEGDYVTDSLIASHLSNTSITFLTSYSRQNQ